MLADAFPQWRRLTLSPTSASVIFFLVLLLQGPVHNRQKRQSHLHMCHLCCNCCKGNKGCGFCCKFWGFPKNDAANNTYICISVYWIIQHVFPIHSLCYTVWFHKQHWLDKKASLSIYLVFHTLDRKAVFFVKWLLLKIVCKNSCFPSVHDLYHADI